MDTNKPNPRRIADRARKMVAEAEANGNRLNHEEAVENATAELYPNYAAARETDARAKAGAIAGRRKAVGAMALAEAADIRAARQEG